MINKLMLRVLWDRISKKKCKKKLLNKTFPLEKIPELVNLIYTSSSKKIRRWDLYFFTTFSTIFPAVCPSW